MITITKDGIFINGKNIDMAITSKQTKVNIK